MRSFTFLICAIVLGSCRQDKPLAIIESSDVKKIETSTVATVDYEGLEKRLEHTTAAITVVNFWATWCKPCIKELPYFEKLKSQYSKDQVEVILVSLDFPDQMERLEAFIEKRNVASEVILLDDADANSWINKVDPSWSGAIPATIIYTNKKRNFYERSFTFQELELELEKFKS